MGIRDDLARTHGGFIGLRELVRALAQSEGVSFEAAAVWLNRKLLDAQAMQDRAPIWRSYSLEAGVTPAVVNSVERARELVGECTRGEDWLTVAEAGEADRLGFRINELTAYLQRHGITLELQPDGTTPVLAPVAQDWPDWRKALAARPLLLVYEAAAALAGVDPHAPGRLSDDERAEVARWETPLEHCIEAGELPRLTHPDGNGGTVLMIRPADLAAWCARVPGGLAYPLPRPQVLPASNPTLREAPQQEAPAQAVFELERITLEADMATLAHERDAALQEKEAQRQRAEAMAAELKALKDAHSVALLQERQQRQQAAEVAGDLAGDHGRALQREKQQRQRADELARELAAVKQGQQEAEAKAAREWARLLDELKDIKAQHVREQERLRAAADEYEELTDALKRARAEMEQVQREDDESFIRLQGAFDRLKSDHEQLRRKQWEQEQGHAYTLQELQQTREELAKLQQAQSSSAIPDPERRDPERVRRKGDLTTKERDTLLVLVAALSEVAGIDWRAPHAAGATLENKTQRMGARVSENGVATHLKRIPEALKSFPEVLQLIPEALRRRSK